MKGDRRYDQIVEAEEALDACGYGDRERRVTLATAHRELYEDLAWRSASTPEEVLAMQLAEGAGARKRGETWEASTRWPWGDATGWLIAKGRTHDEARLRLRDKLVQSARKVTAA